MKQNCAELWNAYFEGSSNTSRSIVQYILFICGTLNVEMGYWNVQHERAYYTHHKNFENIITRIYIPYSQKGNNTMKVGSQVCYL